ncbi:Histidine kinase [Burkholderia sp. 8Y]|nr:Histidine kinase [Burkholderia sp. 8Y]
MTVTRRVPLDDEQECAFWRSGVKEEPSTEPRRILVGHKDSVIGASLSLLLTRKGYLAVHATEIGALRRYLQSWAPHALLLDTRLDAKSHYSFIRDVRADHQCAGLLVLAMSNISPLDSVPALKDAGFDGHVRRPCSVWRVTELIDAHFGRRPSP